MKWNRHLKRLLGEGVAPTVRMKSAGGLISARMACCGRHRIGSRATVMVQSIAPGARNTFSLSADTNEQTGELFSHSSCLISSARPSRLGLPQPPKDDSRGSTVAGSRATNAKAAQHLLKYTNIDRRCRANSVVLKWLIGTQINRVELKQLYGTVPERRTQTLYTMLGKLCTHNLFSGIDNSIY